MVKKREPMFQHLPPDDALVLERVRSEDLGGSGVAPALRELLEERNARVAKRLATSMVLNGTEFFDLVRNCQALGWEHEEGRWHVVPPDRALTSDERVSILSSRGQLSSKLAARIRDGFREREHFTWHTFARGARWHCFFYGNRDVAGDPLTGEQHWAEGPHVHYTSDLLAGGVKREDFVARLQPGEHPSTVHVRFESGFSDEDWAELSEE